MFPSFFVRSSTDVRANTLSLFLYFFAFALFACSPPAEDPTIPDNIFGPMGTVLPSATAEQVEAFDRGRSLSLRRFSPEDGLGPTFNLTSCVGCHEKPQPGGSAPRYRNFIMEFTQLPDNTNIALGNNGVLPTMV